MEIYEKYKKTLYKDELGDNFFMLKYGEAFQYSEKTSRLHLWSKTACKNLAKLCPILNEDCTDDPLYIVDIKITDLPKILDIWGLKKRLMKNSKSLKNKEQKLAHKIIK